MTAGRTMSEAVSRCRRESESGAVSHAESKHKCESLIPRRRIVCGQASIRLPVTFHQGQPGSRLELGWRQQFSMPLRSFDDTDKLLFNIDALTTTDLAARCERDGTGIRQRDSTPQGLPGFRVPDGDPVCTIRGCNATAGATPVESRCAENTAGQIVLLFPCRIPATQPTILCGDHNLIARDAFQRLAHQRFGLVFFGRINEIDPCVKGSEATLVFHPE